MSLPPPSSPAPSPPSPSAASPSVFARGRKAAHDDNAGKKGNRTMERRTMSQFHTPNKDKDRAQKADAPSAGGDDDAKERSSSLDLGLDLDSDDGDFAAAAALRATPVVKLRRLSSSSSSSSSSSGSTRSSSPTGQSTILAGQQLERLIVASPPPTDRRIRAKSVLQRAAAEALDILGSDAVDASDLLGEVVREETASRVLTASVSLTRDVDVAFLVDCTESMGPYIDAVRRYVLDLVRQIKFRYGSALRLAFVGYRDVCDDGARRLEVLDFVATSEEKGMELFRQFVSGVEAAGGGDDCEDVLSGIDAAVKLNWQNNNRRLLHICDMPAHGLRFHGNLVDDDHLLYDRKHPRGLTAEALVQSLKQLNVEYGFCKITKHTDQMIRVFREIGGKKFVQLLNLDRPGMLLNVALESVARTIETQGSGGAIKRKKKNKKSKNKKKKKVEEEILLDSEEPNWGDARKSKIMVAGMKVRPTEEMDEKLAGHANLSFDLDDFKSCRAKIAPSPFAAGGQRKAYYGILKENKKYAGAATMVFKTFQSAEKRASLAEFELAAKIQAVAGMLAQRFNEVETEVDRLKINFVDIKVVQMKNYDPPQYFTMEPLLSPDAVKDKKKKRSRGFVKFNNNSGFVNHGESKGAAGVLQAFSHWTYETTKHNIMVVDLQGIRNDDGFLLTDPSVHSRRQREFGETDFGRPGMKAFFECHTCNRHCRGLGLQTNKLMRKQEE